MMSDRRFANGDRVRHAARPEWGIGTIIKIEAANGSLNGHSPQRLSIRFPNAGLKTLVTDHADLVLVTSESADPLSGGDGPVAQFWDKLTESDWLSPVARRKIEEAMISLPQDVRDPFNSLQKRLTLTLGLYRFNRSGRGLMDWAVAQTGLDDPLSRFSRQELEQKFDRWAHERDHHLAKLLQELRSPLQDQSILTEALKAAPPAAAAAVRRINGSR